jgi:hypothetical protein
MELNVTYADVHSEVFATLLVVHQALDIFGSEGSMRLRPRFWFNLHSFCPLICMCGVI